MVVGMGQQNPKKIHFPIIDRHKSIAICDALDRSVDAGSLTSQSHRILSHFTKGIFPAKATPTTQTYPYNTVVIPKGLLSAKDVTQPKDNMSTDPIEPGHPKASGQYCLPKLPHPIDIA